MFNKHNEEESGIVLTDRVKTSHILVTPAKLILGVGLLIALFVWKDNGRKAIDLLSNVQLGYLAVLVALSLLLNWISAAKWGLILRERGIEISLFRLGVLYLIGKFFNNFTPSMVGGDFTRIALLGRQIGSNAQSATSVFLERFTGIVALVGLALSFSLINFRLLHEPLIATIIGLISLGCIVIAALFFGPGWHARFSQTLESLPAVRRAARKLGVLYAEVSFFRNRYRLLAVALIYSGIFYLLASVSVYFSCRAIGFFPAFLDVALITPIIFLVTSIPVSPNNIGWWEWCVSVLLVEVGAEMAQGLTAGLILRAVTLCVSLVGGILFLLEKTGLPPGKSH